MDKTKSSKRKHKSTCCLTKKYKIIALVTREISSNHVPSPSKYFVVIRMS